MIMIVMYNQGIMQMGCDTDRIVLNFNRFRHESAFTQLMKRVNTVNSTRRCDGAVRAHNTAWI